MSKSAKVDEIIALELGVDLDHVKPEAKLIDDLQADSLDVVQLAIEFEKEWGFEIHDEEVEKLITVADCHDIVERKLA